jgi:hypothetical protein
MFEKIARIKARFDSPQGQLTVEDLFDIPLISSRGKANLDDIARGLSKQVREAETESFVIRPPKADESVALKLEVVKRIITVRLAEAEEAKLKKDNKEKKQRLLSLIAQKEDEQLVGQSIDDLRKMVEEL